MNEGRDIREDSLDSEWSIGQDKPRVQQVCVADSLSIVYSTARGIRAKRLTFFQYFEEQRPQFRSLDVARSSRDSEELRGNLFDFAQNCGSARSRTRAGVVNVVATIEMLDIPRYLSIQYVNRAMPSGHRTFYRATGRPRANKVIVPWWIWTFARLITRAAKKCYWHTRTMRARSQKRMQITNQPRTTKEKKRAE